MPTLTASVGAGQENTRHDTALVQAMLKLIMSSAGRPYLAGSIDGVYGTQTQTAIDAFQDAHGSDATPIRAGMHVLDAGCGIGGTARCLVSEYDCTVSGLNLTPEYVATEAM